MKYDIDPTLPATEAQMQYIRRLYERIDGVGTGSYDTLDIKHLTKPEASERINHLKYVLEKRRRRYEKRKG